MKYKVGDKVKVKSDLKENTSYGGKIFVRDMAVYRGKNVEISKVHDDAYCIGEMESFKESMNTRQKQLLHGCRYRNRIRRKQNDK